MGWKSAQPDAAPEPAHAGRGKAGRGREWLRAVVAIPLVLLLATLAVRENLANVAMDTDPPLAGRLAPDNGMAIDRTVGEGLQAALRQGRQRAQAGPEREARAALAREPFALASLVALSKDLHRSGERAAADRLLDHAAALSRRDMLVQLALVERGARRGDLPAMLRNMDAMLRVHQESYAAIFPVLSARMTRPELKAPLTVLARQDPDWFGLFLGHAVTVNAALPAVRDLLLAAPASRAARDPQMRRNLMSQLVAAGRHDEAERYFVALHGSARGRVRDPAFERPDYEPPFGWTVAREAHFVGGAGLALLAGEGAGGIVAWQMVALPADDYRVELMGEGVDSLVPALTCMTSGADVPVTPLPTPGAFGTTVPPDCPHQHLALRFSGEEQPDPREVTLRRITVTRY